MIRLSTLVWAIIAGLTGFAVYQLKFEVQSLEEELARANRAILDQQVAIHVLRAEWSYLNQPERLRELAGRHLDLQTMTPSQIGQVVELPKQGQPQPPVVTASGKPGPAPNAARKAQAVTTAAKPPAAPAVAAAARKPANAPGTGAAAVPVGHAPGTR